MSSLPTWVVQLTREQFWRASTPTGTSTPATPAAFLQADGRIYHTYSTFGRGIEDFHNGYPHLDLTVLGRQGAWEEPKGRATPLGLHVGGPNMRLPDEYDQA